MKELMKCEYCGCEIFKTWCMANGNKRNYWNTQTIDHKIPRSRGGGNLHNTVKVCRRCNMDKGHLTLDEWNIVKKFRRDNGNPHPFNIKEMCKGMDAI